MRKIHPGVWLVIAAAFGFAGFMLFNQIGSYGADKNHTNTLFTWTAILCTLAFLYSGWRSTQGWKPNDK